MSDDSGRHQDDFEPFEATHEEARVYSHGYRDGYVAGLAAASTQEGEQ